MLLGSAGRQGISPPESRSIPRLDGAVAANPYWPAGAGGLPRCSSGAGSRKLNAGSSGGSGAPKKIRRWTLGSSGDRRKSGSTRGTSHFTSGSATA
jgi:hypothetical protein